MMIEEALTRAKTGNFNNGHGFDMQLLVDTVGIIGELLRGGQTSKAVSCEERELNDFCSLEVEKKGR